MIKALIVDLDGVLRTWGQRPFASIEADHDLPNGCMAAVAFDPKRLLPAITGQVSDESWRAGITAELVARHGPAGARAVQDWSRGCGELDSEVCDLTRAQRETRRVAVLTNATSRLRSDLATLELGAYVDVVFSSADLGVAKPDARAFERVAASLCCSFAECAFVDDSSVNVATAKELGMTGHQYRSPAALAAFLAALEG